MPETRTDPGPFLSGLEWLEGLGEVPLNVFRGRFDSAGRKLADSILDIPDAIIPGDWIPEVARPEDDVTASDVAGVDRQANPGLAKAIDLVGGTAVNPASWLGVRGGAVRAGVPFGEGVEIAGSRAAIEKAKGLAGTAYGKLPEGARKVAESTAQGVRRTMNWLNVPPEMEAQLRTAKASGNTAAQLATGRVEQIYAGLTPVEREAVGEIAHQVNRKGSQNRADWTVLDDPDAYIAGRTDIRPDAVRQALKERQELMDVIANESPDAGVMRIAPEAREKNYINRQFGGDYFDEQSPLTFSRTGAGGEAIKARAKKLRTPEGLVSFLRNEDVDLEFDALKADMGRADQQARLVERGAIGKQLGAKAGIQEPFLLSNGEHRTAISNYIKDLEKQPGMADAAYKLKNVWDGIPARSQNAFVQMLHKGNKVFKGAATYGVLLPRISFDVRNRTSAMWQALSDEQGRKTLPGNVKRVLSDLFGAFDDGVMKLTNSSSRRWGKSALTEQLDFIDNAFKQAKGSTVELRKILGSRKEDGALLQEALDNGVLNNFVDSEQLLSRMASTPKQRRVNDFLEWPAEIAQGLEQRLRLGTFLDLRKNKIAKDGADAAKTVRDVALDYDVAGQANRTFRDIVPFGSFLSQNLKQQGKFLVERPVAGVAAAQLFGDDEGMPKYPWLEQQMTIPFGLDEQNNPQYMSGLGLPIEALTSVPGLDGGDLYRDAVGMLQPLLKTGIAYAADKDPLTGRAFGQYDKIFGEPMGDLGRAFNIAKGTGLTQPVTGPLGQLENALDDRKSIAERALQATTGARFTSVDPDLAERQQLENYLKSRPDIRTAETLYQTGEDPALQAKLTELRAAKERLAAKRKAEAAL
jgi:hypothetical protein